MSIIIRGTQDIISAGDGSLTIEGPFLSGVSTIGVTTVYTTNLSGINTIGVTTVYTASLSGSCLASISNVSGISTTGVTTSGSTVITLIGSGSAASISDGDYVTGIGITPGTLVSSGGGTVKLTLNQTANISNASNPVTFYTPGKVVTPAVIGGQTCRAWVNFNGVGTVAIRAAYNVSSITDNNQGDYTVNFTRAMPDTNYVLLGTAEPSDVPGSGATFYTVIGSNASTAFTRSTTSAQVKTCYISGLAGGGTAWDSQGTYVAFFR